MNFKKEKIEIKDMVCISCEKRLERELRKVNGVMNVKASYADANVLIEYNSDICTVDTMKTSIKNTGYTISNIENRAIKNKPNKIFEVSKVLGVFIIVATIIYLANYSGGIDMSSKLTQNTTFFVLFIVGIFTSIHCVGMCGGIMMSQSISLEKKNSWESVKPTLLYNLGRVIAYTILGGIVGGIGSVFSISLSLKAVITVFAGAFMILMGLNMLGLNILRKLHIKFPWSACSVKNKSKSPLIVGLLNGLMPCGPLQTMQLYALGTGSVAKGAASMFIFALGTVPLMLAFGVATSLISKGYTKKILKFSGILVVILGLIMVNRGLILSGLSVDTFKTSVVNPNKKFEINDTLRKDNPKNGVQEIRITADYKGYTPNVLYVEKGIPVKMIIDGKKLTSCNNQIIIPEFNIIKVLKQGENIIEFTPTSNDISFSCYMGMINGTIKVMNN